MNKYKILLFVLIPLVYGSCAKEYKDNCWQALNDLYPYFLTIDIVDGNYKSLLNDPIPLDSVKINILHDGRIFSSKIYEMKSSPNIYKVGLGYNHNGYAPSTDILFDTIYITSPFPSITDTLYLVPETVDCYNKTRFINYTILKNNKFYAYNGKNKTVFLFR